MAASRNPSSATFPADPAQNPDACFGSTPPFAVLRPLSTDAVRATAREGPRCLGGSAPGTWNTHGSRQASSNHSPESSFSYERRIGLCRTLVIGADVDEPHLPRPCVGKCE
jgi:hypothetical protein